MNKSIAGLACLILAISSIPGVAQLTRKQKEVQGYIQRLKTSKDAKQKVSAIQELSTIAQIRTAYVKPAIPALIESLKDTNADVKSAAINCLGFANMNHDAVVPLMMKSLAKTENGKVRQAAANALGLMGGKASMAIPPLVAIQKEESAKPREQQNRNLLRSVNDSLRNIQASFKADADRAIATLRGSKDAIIRAGAVKEVARIGKLAPAYATAAHNALVDAWVKDNSKDVRDAVKSWITTAKPDPKIVVNRLLQILNNTREQQLNRVAAATMLGSLRAEAKGAIPALTSLKAKEKDQQVLTAVSFALRTIERAVGNN